MVSLDALLEIGESCMTSSFLHWPFVTCADWRVFLSFSRLWFVRRNRGWKLFPGFVLVASLVWISQCVKCAADCFVRGLFNLHKVMSTTRYLLWTAPFCHLHVGIVRQLREPKFLRVACFRVERENSLKEVSRAFFVWLHVSPNSHFFSVNEGRCQICSTSLLADFMCASILQQNFLYYISNHFLCELRTRWNHWRPCAKWLLPAPDIRRARESAPFLSQLTYVTRRPVDLQKPETLAGSTNIHKTASLLLKAVKAKEPRPREMWATVLNTIFYHHGFLA